MTDGCFPTRKTPIGQSKKTASLLPLKVRRRRVKRHVAHPVSFPIVRHREAQALHAGVVRGELY